MKLLSAVEDKPAAPGGSYAAGLLSPGAYGVGSSGDGSAANGEDEDVDDVEHRVVNTHLLDLPPSTPELKTILRKNTTTLRRAGYSTQKRDVLTPKVRTIKVCSHLPPIDR